MADGGIAICTELSKIVGIEEMCKSLGYLHFHMKYRLSTHIQVSHDLLCFTIVHNTIMNPISLNTPHKCLIKT